MRMDAVNRAYLGSAQAANATSWVLLDVGENALPRLENFFNLALMCKGDGPALLGMAKPSTVA